MRFNRWLPMLALLIAGAVLGATCIMAGIEFNRHTSTATVCTSCHSMTFVAADGHFQQSRHRTKNGGVPAQAHDLHCHFNLMQARTPSAVDS